MGSKQEIASKIVQPTSDKTAWFEFLHSITINVTHPLAILLAQIVTILFVSRIFAWIFKKIGQPTVIGEIIAGIVLGPSLVGLFFPEFTAFLFPPQSMGNLHFLSQIGLILFMFIVGMEIDVNVLKNKAHDAVVISHASIIIPFSLGMGLAYFIYNEFAPPEVSFTSFGLFIGIALSITAFPVLARIVQERGLQKTRLGTIVITCAAADNKVATLFKVSGDIESDITDMGNKGEYDLLIVGIGQSIFEGSLLGKILGFTTRIINPDRIINQVKGGDGLFENSPFDERTRTIINKSRIPVGILIDKGFTKATTVFIPVVNDKDAFLIDYAKKLINYSNSQLSFIDINNNIHKNSGLKETIREIENIAPNHIRLLSAKNSSPEFIKKQSLMLLSLESWKQLIDEKSNWLTDIPSTLIIANKE